MISESLGQTVTDEEKLKKEVERLSGELLEMKAVVRSYDSVVNHVLPKEMMILFMNSTPSYYNQHKQELLASAQIKSWKI